MKPSSSHLAVTVCFLAAMGSSTRAGEFAEISKQRLAELKAAKDMASWTAAMPEAQPHVYKTVDEQPLPLYVFPAKPDGERLPPALVLFAGGAFRSGSPTGFYRQALDYRARGITVVLPKYRGTGTDGQPVVEAYRDGRDAVAWVREHAEQLGIHRDRIAAGGSSAGAVLALAIATLPFLHEEAEHERGRPDGLLLYDVGGGAAATAPIEGDPQFGPEPPGRWKWYSRERFGGDPRTLSPFHHLHEKLPPAAMFLGGKESARTQHGAWLLYRKASELGAEWDLHFILKMPHAGMVNSAGWEPQVYRTVIESTVRFMRRHEFLDPQLPWD